MADNTCLCGEDGYTPCWELKAQVEHYTDQARQNGYRAAAAEDEVDRLKSVCRLVAHVLQDEVLFHVKDSSVARQKIRNLIKDLQSYGRAPKDDR